MKKKIFCFTAMILTAILLCCACSSSSAKIRLGTWSGKSFENTWSGIRFTLQDGYEPLSSDKLKEVLAQGQDMVVNEGLASKSEIEASKFKTAYEFMIIFPDETTNVSLAYESITGLSNRNLTEKESFEVLREQFEQLEAYTYVKDGTATIAGEKYYTAAYSVSGMLHQKLYVRKIDSVMMLFTATYTSASENAIYHFFQDIEAA